MEQVFMWIAGVTTILTVIIIPIFNALITNKIDAGNLKDKELEKSIADTKEVFFRKLDEDRLNSKETYVRKDLYEQTFKSHMENGDEKFKSMLAIIQTNSNHLEDKLTNIQEKMEEKMKDVKDLASKIDNLREFVNNKLNNK